MARKFILSMTAIEAQALSALVGEGMGIFEDEESAKINFGSARRQNIAFKLHKKVDSLAYEARQAIGPIGE